MNNVICLKWGSLYPAEYVNRIYRGVKAHLHRQFRFVCITDDTTGLDAGIDTAPIPAPPAEMVFTPRYPSWPNIYVKLCLFKKGLANLEGPTLFLDIDQIITGDLDCFFDYKPGKFCIIHNWIELRKRLFRAAPKIGNSSCFRFEAGEEGDRIYRQFVADLPSALDTRLYRTEQQYMTHAVGLDNVNFWPNNFVVSFKRSCAWPWPLNHFLAPRKPKDGRILCFHGRPSPEEAIAGYRGKHLNTWTKPAAWLKELWTR